MELSALTELVEGGKIFSVEFYKRSTGDLRRMVARTGVRPATRSPQGATYDPSRHGLLLVWDMQARGYRTIPADAVLRVKARGHVITTELAT